jgi:hypothetical protein
MRVLLVTVILRGHSVGQMTFASAGIFVLTFSIRLSLVVVFSDLRSWFLTVCCFLATFGKLNHPHLTQPSSLALFAVCTVSPSWLASSSRLGCRFFGMSKSTVLLCLQFSEFVSFGLCLVWVSVWLIALIVDSPHSGFKCF